MEALLVFAALVALAIPVLVIVLLVAVSGLRRQFALLERRAAMLEHEVKDLRARSRAAPPEVPATPAVPDLPEMPAPPQPPAPELPEAAEAPPIAPGPWENLPPAAARSSEPVVVARPERGSTLGDWLVANWVYAVSALSLALAGIFLVQYGVENGLLPPPMRVAAAILLGLALIGAGEWLRRRWGDSEHSATAYLPSTFSGAGLVSIFGGVLAARQLYELIGPEVAFAGLLATAALAVVLGWFHGPFLAAVGLLGAAAAPFLVGGESEAPYWLYGYFAVIAGAGLAIDTIRRWAWVSVLALVLGHAGAWLTFAGTGGGGWYALTLTVLVALAILIPARGILPDHQGPMLAEALWRKGQGGWPHFPTRLAGGAVAAAAVILTLLPAETGAESLLVFLCLAALALALTTWSGPAPALSDLTLLPVAGFLLRLGLEGLDRWPLAREFAARAIHLREPETAPPLTATLLLALALAVTLAAAWASGGAGRLKPFWAAGAALAAPLTALVMELFWAPSAVLGTYTWALHVIGLAAIMVALALGFARADGEDRRRAAYATLSALSLIALALFLITTKGALTLALSALVVAAAALDRRFRLPEMGLFIQAAVIVLSWRLVIDPGLAWAVDGAALWEVIASYGGAAAAMAAGLFLLSGLERRAARVFLESAFAGYTALTVNVLLTRWLTTRGTGEWVLSHWGLALNAMPWLVLMLVQLYRLQLGGVLRWLRWAIAGIAALIGFGGLLLATGPANPLFARFIGGPGAPEWRVYGPPVLDTLLVAYGLPGLLLLLGAARLGHLNRWLRIGLGAVGVAFAALYAGLEIRRLWRGDDLSVPGVTQGELYSYTIALMLVGAVLLYQAIARRSQDLRRIAMTVIALTIAKVFLIDASGLSGLTRVASFLALGLSLAALAWLNRWAAGRQGGVTPPE
ncbi:DUF2339 domain-containing protein [Defluviimonas salinarum]|uniref:DUF2339 domain-containing protein n=1 Tax=Defluviimonas salinarum TaxID=2992147 RepID=A0ABT3J8T8_9RHOB|nr:DUF2339 domain-containing protein [Defluviimonas salinarum]MCW3784076.1 DUF2339 domain-containing protein [Defluviimonas salinarum]